MRLCAYHSGLLIASVRVRREVTPLSFKEQDVNSKKPFVAPVLTSESTLTAVVAVSGSEPTF